MNLGIKFNTLLLNVKISNVNLTIQYQYHSNINSLRDHINFVLILFIKRYKIGYAT